MIAWHGTLIDLLSWAAGSMRISLILYCNRQYIPYGNLECV